MDRARLNAIVNALKEMVGEQGSFIIFASSGERGGDGEDVQIRSHGPLTRQVGLLELGGEILTKHTRERLDKVLKKLVEPD